MPYKIKVQVNNLLQGFPNYDQRDEFDQQVLLIQSTDVFKNIINVAIMHRKYHIQLLI